MTWSEAGDPQWLSFAVFLVLLTVATSVRIGVDVRRQTISMNAVDIPFLLALFYLSPFWVIVLRVAAGVMAYSYRRYTTRSAFVKVAFNVASTCVGTACAAVLVMYQDLGGATDTRTWGILLLAVLTLELVTAVLVYSIIAIVQGWPGLLPLFQSLMSTSLLTVFNGTLGILILLAIESTAWAALPLIVLAVIVVGLYYSYAQLLERRRSLADLNEFTQVVTESVQSNRLIDAMLGRLRDMIRAEYATVWVPADKHFPELLLTARLDETGLLDTTLVPLELRQHVLDTGVSLQCGPKFGTREQRALLRREGVADVIVVPLRSGKAVYGCIAVANRLGGEIIRFGESDLRLLDTLAAHVSVAVENTRLIDRLRHDAYHDSLTGLANRRRTIEALEESISITVPGEVVAVLMCDVDGMREINDAVGHSAGDKLLVEFAHRLTDLAPPGSHVGRIDGDEFAVLLRMADVDAATELAERLREQLQQPCTLESLTVDLDTAIGVVVHPDSGEDADTLLQRAEVATQTAKRASSGVQVYNTGLESRSVRRLGLAADLRRAFDADELEVHYQPKIALADRRLVGVECLARWRHPTHGYVAPDDFIPVAEHTGLLGRLTEFVLRHGLARVRDWSTETQPIGVAVNLSPKTLTDIEFPTQVRDLLDEYDVPAHLLTLEITEDGMIGEPGRPLPILQRLHDLGVRLSVDDFGTGYSSLSHLRRLPVHEIKIDRGFVQGMATDSGDHAIVRAVVDLARHFDMTVVAEGVESQMTLDRLTDIGCDIGQGFYFSRPLPAERFVAWMANQAAADGADGRSEPGGPRLRAV